MVAAPSVTTTFFVDSDLEYSTTYSYCVVAVAAGGATALSSVVTASTGREPDVLSGAVSPLSLKRGSLFAGPVASFTDANTTTSASQFVAMINWGDGRSSVAAVSGGAGSFVVNAHHSYAKNGHYALIVTVTMTGPNSAGAEVAGTAVVSNNPPRQRQRVRIIRRVAKKPSKPAKPRHK
jgi:hypothetical protein